MSNSLLYPSEAGSSTVKRKSGGLSRKTESPTRNIGAKQTCRSWYSSYRLCDSGKFL